MHGSMNIKYKSVNIVNKVTIYVVDSVENKKQFIGKLKNLLIDQLFYFVNKFLNHKIKQQTLDSQNTTIYIYIYIYIYTSGGSRHCPG